MSRWHVYGTKYVFSTPSVFPGGMDSTLSCLLSQDIQLPGHDLSLSGINLFFLFFFGKCAHGSFSLFGEIWEIRATATQRSE